MVTRLQMISPNARTQMFKSLRREWLEHQRLRYLIVGAWNTGFAYIAFFALYFLLQDHLHYVLIAVFAHFLAVANAFSGHRWLVFKSNGALIPEFLRFNLTYVAALVWSLGSLMLCVEILKMSPLISQCLVGTVSVLVTYLLHKYFSFREI